jgi:methyl-accepting chemotaxis protein
MSDNNSGDTENRDYTVEGNSILPQSIGGSFLAKFVISLLLVLVLVGGVSAYTFTQTSDQLSTEVEEEYTNVANQSALQIDNWLDARGDTAVRLSNLGDMESGDVSTVQARIDEEMGRLPDDIEDVHYIDMRNGEAVATSRPQLQPLEIDNDNDGEIDEREFSTLSSNEAPWVTQSIDDLEFGDDDLFVSEPVFALRQSNIYFISPVETEGERDIVLVMQANLDALASDLGTNEETEFTQIVNQQGDVVADSQEDEGVNLEEGINEFPAYIEGQSSLPAFISGQSGFVESVNKGGSLDEDHVAGYATVSGGNLVVVTHVPSAQAFSLRSTITNSLLVLVGAVFLGFLVIGFTFGRGTVNALSRLTTKAEELEGGNLDVDLSVNRADEFGRLTAAFAGMRDSLRDRIQEAEHSRREAEIARTEAEQLAEYLQEKAEEYSDVMQQVSAGDLTQGMEIDKENDAMDQIASDFNEMVTELEKTIGQLQSFSGEVMDSGEFVLSSTENIRQASEDVADSAQRISDDAHQQQNRLRTVVSDIDTVISTFERLLEENPELDVDEELDQLREFKSELEAAVETSDGLLTETENVAGAAEEQAAELNEVSARADRLKRYAQPLGEIVNKFDTDEEHEFVFSTGPTESPTETGND